MNAREERGLVIAALCKLNRKESHWLVPSQSGAAIYNVDPHAMTCTCPDHQERGEKCKHLYAVEFTIKRETDSEGNIIETKTLTFTEKKTYKQNWPVYNDAQQNEKKRFLSLLFDLTRGIPNQERDPKKVGRKPTLLRDMVFASVFKVYSTISSRRFACDLADAYEKGYMASLMNSIAICAYLENPTLTPILQTLVEQAAMPLRSVETTFAPDSTGFSCSRFVRWYDEKYGVTRSEHDWVKAHAMCGCKTHIVTAVEIHDRHAADSPQFKALVETTAKNFTIKEVPADKAYLSHANLEQIEFLGGKAYVPFKSNSVAGEPGRLWEKMFLYYQFNREEFMMVVLRKEGYDPRNHILMDPVNLDPHQIRRVFGEGFVRNDAQQISWDETQSNRDPKESKLRLVLELEEELDEKLSQLASDAGVSKKEFVRRLIKNFGKRKGSN